ncbi:3,4-dihydroxy-2-butanone-4-phosphate synthase [Arthrobacter sp. zg-Y820]|uniref:3,4-dihydroxy-2-butanone-4-phosphate synthase n=1 Tax=unclassified Arthrobacter TaxID=235627 RepID=UPI001E591A55|nr:MULTISPECIES: 3,4-dihydroxy-2-butanone-4-phosphate synthase [unclassified Arthrobacter]MCC9197670.1 3,4-dihydroxy-2-butanone-4-phosphate synthase [Arthrobacter sp. zg-Y820]MDK1280537.1 3,4-dihydroxy-2-butanone-4-phosphate synthase [Arthrobacter sp. zg.Y820]WIB10824.1 3,4-dihydroxy-2-butanone-4-phosphate synthase [Arthrobacter sp. zg-Y820]
MSIRLDSIAAAVEAIAAGRPVVVVDDEDRENEGDIIFAAQHATPELMGWTVRYSSGVICVPLPAAYADRLNLPPMTAVNEDAKGTAYTVSCDAAEGITTGISAADRAATSRILADPAAAAAELTRPGHIFPLRAHDDGVRGRRGHTEAAVELARLAGCTPVGVIAELVHDEGAMMRLPALREFADTHGIPLVSIEDLAAHLDTMDRAGTPVTSAAVVPGPEVQLPTAYGDFTARAWTDPRTGAEHMSVSAPGTGLQPDAAGAGSIGNGTGAPLVRLHSECLTGDVFGSYRCDCGEQLEQALELIHLHGGTVIYLRGHEGRGIGLANKLRAYALQEAGADTVEANEQLGLPVDSRDYEAAADILHVLGLNRIRLLSNNPAKRDRLQHFGITVEAMVPSEVPIRAENERYLQTKRDRMDHHLTLLRTQPVRQS